MAITTSNSTNVKAPRQVLSAIRKISEMMTNWIRQAAG